MATMRAADGGGEGCAMRASIEVAPRKAA